MLPKLDYGNQAGGGTVHYGSVSWRFHEDDFRARSHTVERRATETTDFLAIRFRDAHGPGSPVFRMVDRRVVVFYQ